MPESAALRLPAPGGGAPASDGGPLGRLRQPQWWRWVLFSERVCCANPTANIDGRPVYDREEALQTTAYFEAFAALDASDRLLDVWMDDQK